MLAHTLRSTTVARSDSRQWIVRIGEDYIDIIRKPTRSRVAHRPFGRSTLAKPA